MSIESYYEAAANEVAEGRENKGMLARIYAESDGDEAKSRARYIKERAAQLQSEAEQKIKEQQYEHTHATRVLQLNEGVARHKARMEWIVVWADYSWKKFWVVMSIAGFLPLLFRPMPGGFPGLLHAPLQIIFSWAALTLGIVLVSAIMGAPIMLCALLYTGRRTLTFSRFGMIGLTIYLIIDLIIMRPPFFILCGSGHAYWIWW